MGWTSITMVSRDIVGPFEEALRIWLTDEMVAFQHPRMWLRDQQPDWLLNASPEQMAWRYLRDMETGLKVGMTVRQREYGDVGIVRSLHPFTVEVNGYYREDDAANWEEVK